jgi:HlyD family secretion protein
LFTVAGDLTKMQIDTSVAEADIGKIKVGQEVIYNLDGYPNTNFTGKVLQVRLSPTTVSNVVTYDVVISVDNKDLTLKPGMTANVSIITAKKNNVLIVPNATLRFTLNQSDDAPKYKEHGIWVLRDKKPTRIDVKTGVSDGSFTEIVSKDVKEGEKVIKDMLTGSSKKNDDGPKPSPMMGMR